jgi:hypothetical protein
MYNRIKAGGTYHCELCNKLTRDTGYGEASLNYCKKCMLECEMENAEADYGPDSDEFKQAEKAYNDCK